jgi:hypothetical protein
MSDFNCLISYDSSDAISYIIFFILVIDWRSG